MYTRRKAEEIANSVTHGIGFMGAIALTTLLIVRAALHGNAWHITTYSIFGAGMILLYLASTLYHSARNLRKKSALNVFDHSSIYFLIAATYTPICLVGLKGGWGWTIFGVIWAMAIGGLVYKVWFYTVKWRSLSAWMYFVMACTILIAIVPMIQRMPNISLWFILIGCICYSVGLIFYLIKKIPFGHTIFHLLIIAGSLMHFFSFYYLL